MREHIALVLQDKPDPHRDVDDDLPWDPVQLDVVPIRIAGMIDHAQYTAGLQDIVDGLHERGRSFWSCETVGVMKVQRGDRRVDAARLELEFGQCLIHP